MIRITEKTIFTAFGSIPRNIIPKVQLDVPNGLSCLIPSYDEGVSGQYIPISPVLSEPGYKQDQGHDLIIGAPSFVNSAGAESELHALHADDILIDWSELRPAMLRYFMQVAPEGSALRSSVSKVRYMKELVQLFSNEGSTADQFEVKWYNALIGLGKSIKYQLEDIPTRSIVVRDSYPSDVTPDELCELITDVADLLVFGFMPLIERHMVNSIIRPRTSAQVLFRVSKYDLTVQKNQAVPHLFNDVDLGVGLCYMIGGPSTGKTTQLLGNDNYPDTGGHLHSEAIYIPYRERHSSVTMNQNFVEALLAACLAMRVPFAVDSMFMETVMNDAAKMMTGISRASFNNFISLSNICSRRVTTSLIVVTWPSARADVAMEVLTMATASATALVTVRPNEVGESTVYISHADYGRRRFIPIQDVAKFRLFRTNYDIQQVIDKEQLDVSPPMVDLTQKAGVFAAYFGFSDDVSALSKYSGVRESDNTVEVVNHVQGLSANVIIND